MIDWELIELAARACHLPECGWMDDSFSYVKDNTWAVWNPLEDDGDALRLAVKLGIRIDWIAFDVVCVDFNSNYTAREYKKDDPYSATRRAIVRIAAEIGKSMN